MGWASPESCIWPDPQPEVHQMKLSAWDIAALTASVSYLGQDALAVGVGVEILFYYIYIYREKGGVDAPEKGLSVRIPLNVGIVQQFATLGTSYLGPQLARQVRLDGHLETV